MTELERQIAIETIVKKWSYPQQINHSLLRNLGLRLDKNKTVSEEIVSIGGQGCATRQTTTTSYMIFDEVERKLIKTFTEDSSGLVR